MEETSLLFNTLEEFHAWKAEEEEHTSSSFVQNCGQQRLPNARVWYYYCNRAGTYKSKGSGKRQLKSQGSSKLGEQCSAHIKVSEDIASGIITAKYCKTHHNHQIKLAHIRIPQHIRMDLAAKLQQGITMERILDDIRDSVTFEMKREHLVTRQDLHNVKHQYNIEGICRHKNDLTSVTAWVEEMSKLPTNPIILFKQQGFQPSNTTNVMEPDFILCIQTNFQKDMILKFGNDTICMDSTHGTNMYDFKLVTIAVIDEYGEGIPVGWMISNREDAAMLSEFLKAIRKCTGNIQPNWFMTDDAEQYFNAWKAVFGCTDKTRKILCAWHIDRSWRNALKEHVKCKESQIHIYHNLRTILAETDEAKFRVILQEFVSFLDNDHTEFCNYFRTYYCKRLQQWATCFRSGSTANTNMFLEAFHRVLKIVYLHHKQNRRVDYLLTTLRV